MAIINLSTKIKAPVATCFDLSRSIDLHISSMQHSKEKAIAGKTCGLIGLNEWVTWQTNHLGLKFNMTIRISEFAAADYFVDEIVKGPFKMLRHLHQFKQAGSYTIMTDEFIFKSPFGWLGKLVDKFFMERYMRKLLTQRNAVIKEAAER
ncbi:SRPBCC family protein [Mucilaginibacter pedocola]|uniref:Cell division protein n=1 Tax=Mucilaginibacter pedocola TaxID=1792845 RepID=A0A1S9PIL4_9SPHI|nr:SRPBCC family protein [Mucilaginibacter pedocola]OOQ60810.1 cell division protein [Mucilaginibacter pedocola]